MKKPLHVSFRRRVTIHNTVLMDIGQELALAFGVGWFHNVLSLVDFVFSSPQTRASVAEQLRITNEELRIGILASLCTFLDRCNDAAEFFGIGVDTVKLG